MNNSGNTSTTTNNNTQVADNSNNSVNDSGNTNNTTNTNTQMADNSNNSVNTSYDASFNTNTETAGNADNSNNSTFGDGALVASASLSNYVSGVHVSFGSAAGEQGSPDNSLTTGDNAFQNFAGMQAINLNTGAAASQSSNVSVAIGMNNVDLGGHH